MVYDPKRSSTPSSPSAPTTFDLDDVPPSYDSLVSGPSASSSSSTANPASGHPAAVDTAPPERFAHLFSAPPGAEPMLGRNGSTVMNVIGRIASFTSRYNGNCYATTSWDPQLNDPNVLYDWIRAQATRTPKFTLKVKGTRPIVAERSETVMVDGSPKEVKAGETYHVTDFDFFIDLSPVVNHEYTQANVFIRAVQPWEPAKRRTWGDCFGSLFAPIRHESGWIGEQSVTAPGRALNMAESKQWRDRMLEGFKKGIPTWAKSPGDMRIYVGPVGEADEELLLGNPTEGWDRPMLKEWCEAYCADRGWMKSFVATRDMWGWDTEGITAAVKSAIESTGYPAAQTEVTFACDEDFIKVIPNNWLSKAIYTPWIFALLCITLVYPLIWVWSRFHSLAGAPYEVTRMSYAFKFYPPLPDTYLDESLESAQSRLAGLFKLHSEIPKQPFLQRGPKGIHYLIGRREGEWFREWEDRIRMAVRMRYSGELEGTIVSETAPPDLDGY